MLFGEPSFRVERGRASSIPRSATRAGTSASRFHVDLARSTSSQNLNRLLDELASATFAPHPSWLRWPLQRNLARRQTLCGLGLQTSTRVTKPPFIVYT